MGMVVTLFLALAAMTLSYALGQGGPIAGMVFFTVLFIGAAIRVVAPQPSPAWRLRRGSRSPRRYSASSTIARSPAVFACFEEGAQVVGQRLLALGPTRS